MEDTYIINSYPICANIIYTLDYPPIDQYLAQCLVLGRYLLNIYYMREQMHVYKAKSLLSS